MLPQDAFMLLSFINTKLRDEYPTLDDLCEDLRVDIGGIEEKLREIDYTYDEELNKFV